MSAMAPGPLPYHREVVAWLRQHEATAWALASRPADPVERAKAVHLQLLKSTYRLEPASHGALYELVAEVAARLVPGMSVRLYQAQGSVERGACVLALPGEAHIILQGDLASFLSPAELRAVLAHELAHRQLLLAEEGQYQVAEVLLRALANEPQPANATLQTLRRWALYTELYADRCAWWLTGDPELTITALLKTSTGMASAQAVDYLRQAEEILASGPVTSTGETHPEVFIRALGVAWTHRATLTAASAGGQSWQVPLPAGFDLETALAKLINGPAKLAEFDLLDQARWTALTAEYWQWVLARPWAQDSRLLPHARRYFPDLPASAAPGTAPSAPADPTVPPALAAWAPALAEADEALRDYAVGLLLELATADPELGEVALAQALELAEQWGVRDRFRDLASKDLGHSKRALDKLFNERQRLLEQAGGRL